MKVLFLVFKDGEVVQKGKYIDMIKDRESSHKILIEEM